MVPHCSTEEWGTMVNKYMVIYGGGERKNVSCSMEKGRVEEVKVEGMG